MQKVLREPASIWEIESPRGQYLRLFRPAQLRTTHDSASRLAIRLTNPGVIAGFLRLS